MKGNEAEGLTQPYSEFSESPNIAHTFVGVTFHQLTSATSVDLFVAFVRLEIITLLTVGMKETCKRSLGSKKS